MCSHTQVLEALIANQITSDTVALVLLWIFYDANEFHSNLIGHYSICCAAAYTSHFGSFIFSLCISVLSLFLYVFNQFIAICFPFYAACHITIRHASIAIGGVWGLATIFAVIPGILLSNYWTGYTLISKSEMQRKTMEICAIFLTILIVIIILLHCIIYFVTLRRSRVMLGVRHHSTVFCSESGKSFATCFLFIASLVLFWLPFTMFHFVHFSTIEPILDSAFSAYFECYVIDFLPLLNLFFNSLIHTLRKIRFGRLTSCLRRVPNHNNGCDRRLLSSRYTTACQQNRLCPPSIMPSEYTTSPLVPRVRYSIVHCNNGERCNEVEMHMLHSKSAPNLCITNNSDEDEMIRETCV